MQHPADLARLQLRPGLHFPVTVPYAVWTYQQVWRNIDSPAVSEMCRETGGGWEKKGNCQVFANEEELR